MRGGVIIRTDGWKQITDGGVERMSVGPVLPSPVALSLTLSQHPTPSAALRKERGIDKGKKKKEKNRYQRREGAEDSGWWRESCCSPLSLQEVVRLLLSV